VTEIQITDHIAIREDELDFSFVQSSGPGGQHVNKAATAVQLRFDVAHSTSLPDDVRERLKSLAGSRLTQDGVLIIESQRSRSQERNRQDAVNRLIKLLQRAAKKPKRRVKTKPSRAAREQRLQNKRQRSEKKRLRRTPRHREE